MSNKEPITVEGLKKLSEELVFLKEKKRPEIVNAISEARSHGDLKENAEYHAAKEQQSLNEGRIQEVEDTIARANVIDVTKLENDGKVIFGATVSLQDLDSNEKMAEMMNRFPKIMERPILVKGKKAVVGRPPENILELVK